MTILKLEILSYLDSGYDVTDSSGRFEKLLASTLFPPSSITDGCQIADLDWRRGLFRLTSTNFDTHCSKSRAGL